MADEANKTRLHSVELGTGDPVLLLHCNASSSAQWKRLTDQLKDGYRTIAVDCLGAGNSPPLPRDGNHAFGAEIAALNRSLDSVTDELVLIGHSYGGGLAFHYAIRHPERVRAIVVYEPTLFSLARLPTPALDPTVGIWDAVDRATEALANGKAEHAARVFIDFWAVPGAFDNMSPQVKDYVVSTIADVETWRATLFDDPTPISAYRNLTMPVLIMTGSASPTASRSVAEVLLAALPQVTHVEFEGLGHMGPISHPDPVNRAVSGFLDKHCS